MRSFVRTGPGGTIQNAATYSYDAEGERVQKSVTHPSAATVAYFDVNAVLTSTRLTKHIQVGGQRVGSVLKNLSTGTNTYYQVVTDHVGTSSMVVTGTSANEWTLTSPYGKVLARKKTAGVLDVDYLYTGKELDAESGLSYFGARYLDHQTVGARWISPDPEWLKQGPIGLNPYQMTYWNPVKFTDPDGRIGAPAWLLWAALEVGSGTAAGTAGTTTTWGMWGAFIAAGTIYAQAMRPPEVLIRDEDVRSTPNVWAMSQTTPQAKGTPPATTPAPSSSPSDPQPPKKDDKRHTPDQQALTEMAKGDKQRGGITAADMEAYKDLNREAGANGFTTPGAVRGPEAHPPRTPQSPPGPGQSPHGHVGPVGHIPVKVPPTSVPTTQE